MKDIGLDFCFLPNNPTKDILIIWLGIQFLESKLVKEEGKPSRKERSVSANCC